jgi:hypothetical protein
MRIPRMFLVIALVFGLMSCPLKKPAGGVGTVEDVLEFVGSVDLPGDAACHTQGLTVFGPYLFASCADTAAKKGWVYRYETPENFPFELGAFDWPEMVDLTKGDMYHPSGLAHDDACVWLAMAEYKKDKAKSRVICLDPETLTEKSSFEVDDHIGAVTFSEDRLVLFNWDARDIYQYSRDGQFIGKSPSPSPIAYQDCGFEFGSPILFCSGPGRLNGRAGAVVEVLEPDPETAGGFQVQVSLFTGQSGVNLGREGFELVDGPFWLFLPEDFPKAKVYVYTSNE